MLWCSDTCATSFFIIYTECNQVDVWRSSRTRHLDFTIIQTYMESKISTVPGRSTPPLAFFSLSALTTASAVSPLVISQVCHLMVERYSVAQLDHLDFASFWESCQFKPLPLFSSLISSSHCTATIEEPAAKAAAAGSVCVCLCV